MPPKRKGFEFYEHALRNAKFVVAPMVDASELAWRVLARRYGAQLCFTPMWHSGVFIRDERYRNEALQTCPEDRPLIVQFCANNPDTFKKAVEYTLQMIDCDAIDLNIGCPQIIAKRGHFGSFLQDEWDLLHQLVRTIHDNFDVPITCKIRIFEDVQRTVDYARMLESAGCQMLTVHGRTREQKGALTGVASWDHIRAVREAVSIPVIANGNIQSLDDVERCIEETGVRGVMSAEGHLSNPALFAGKTPLVWDIALEYMELAERYPCPTSYVRGHLFKLLHNTLQIKENFDLRLIIAKGSSIDEFRSAVVTLRERMLPFAKGEKEWTKPQELEQFKLRLSPWLCQPYERPPPEEHIKKLMEVRAREKAAASSAAVANAALGKRVSPGGESAPLSKKKLKKLERCPAKQFPHCREKCRLCAECPNPAGTKCEMDLCRQCCRSKCYKEELDCEGHRIQVRTKRESARARNAETVTVDA